MDIKNRIGQYLKINPPGEPYIAYIPKPLPPEPALKLNNLNLQLDQAALAFGELKWISPYSTGS